MGACGVEMMQVDYISQKTLSISGVVGHITGER